MEAMTAFPAGQAGDLLEFDPFSAAFQADPYPTYHRLRAVDPVALLCWSCVLGRLAVV